MNEFGQPIGDPTDYAGATPAAPITLAGKYVRLVPLTEEHVEPLFELRSHPQLWTYLNDDLTSIDTVRDGVRAMQDAPDLVAFALLDPTSGQFRGRATYLRIQPALGSIEVGHIIYSPALQRTPAATEAQYLLLKHAFDDLGYRRYEWKCDSLNAPSRRAAARYGFVDEGTWRNALVYKGRNRDTTWFSITDTEWPAVKAAFEGWLAEDNFDSEGTQRTALADFRRDG